MDKVNTFESAMLGLTQAVAANHDLIMANRDLIMENREQITEARREIAETNQKLDAMLQHFEVPYKPPTGFIERMSGKASGLKDNNAAQGPQF